MYGSILATTFVIAGGVIMWIAKMAHDETLPPNYWAGIRTPRTLHSDEAWRVGHKAAAVWIFLAACPPLPLVCPAFSYPMKWSRGWRSSWLHFSLGHY